MNTRKRVQNVMIKPTHDCDMNCEYCFVSNLTEKYREQRMSIDTLNDVFRVLSNSAEEVRIIWHGGEPTMLGVEWYRDMLELSYLYSDKTKFTHSMQSNGMTLDEEWADLAKNYGVNIAVSYDGIFQDFRKKGTKERVEKNLIRYKEIVGGVGCLSVITENSYRGMIENYEYFKSIGVWVTYNYGINPNPDGVESFNEITTEEYIKEYMKFFYHWINDYDGGVPERSCMAVINQVLGKGATTCSTSDCRYKWVNVNPDGTTAHCNRYFPEELGMGNIVGVENVGELYDSPGYKKFCDMAQVRIDNGCKDCSHITYCNGGCNSMHLMNTGSIETVDKEYCKRFKMEFLQVYKAMREIDIHATELNNNYIELLRGVYTPREVKDFLNSLGVGKEVFVFDEDDLLESKEFKLYRVFNPPSGSIVGHTDYVHVGGKGGSMSKENRYNDMFEIYKLNIDNIEDIIG